MHTLALLRLFLLLAAAAGFFVMLRTLIVRHTLKGFRLVAAGFALIYLNIVIGSLFHSGLLPEAWNEHVLPLVGNISGYVGQTLGLFLLLIGNYRLVRSLVPHLSEHYSSLVEKSLVGVYLIQDGVFKFVNPRFAEIFGYDRDELLDMPINALIDPDSRATVAENIRKRIEGERETLRYTFTGQKKNGQKVLVEVHGSRTSHNGMPAVHGTLLDITESKRSEEVLRESEERFRTVVESLGEGLIITDVDDKVLYINSRMAEITGYSAEEMVGNVAYTYLLQSNEWNRLKERNRERLKGKEERYEVLLTRKNGTQLWTEINATPFRDNEGTIIGTLGAVTDIQERKRAETLQSALYRIAEKTQSSVDLQQFYSSVHSLISELMSAKNFYIALCDPSKETISFPYFVDEVDPPPGPRKFGKGLTEYILRTGQPLLASPDVFEQLLKMGEVESLGAPSLDWLGVPLKSGNSIFGAIVVQTYTEEIRYGEKDKEILTFVSQHIATAIQRKADEERFRAVWEHSADGMRLTDKDGRIVMVNSAYCRLVKLPPEKLVGQLLSATYRSESKDTVVRNYRERFESQTVVERFSGELTLWNGAEISVEVSNSFIMFGLNEKMLLSVLRDISERKLLQDQLIQAQKMESIGVLAGGIAHDFNNVLSMIMTSAEMLKEKTKSDKVLQHYADMVATAAERGASIAKQLLLFSRSEKGKLTPLSLSPIILEVQRLLDHTFPKTIAIRSEIETGSATIMGDSDQLHQALLNLALNARDAIEARSSRGAISFRVGVAAQDDLEQRFPSVQHEKYVVLSVSDTGIGMSEETQRRMFEPFFSTKERGKGTGLGLSIVHGIVQNHQGLVHVQSAIDKGTTITFYFPLVNMKPDTVGHEQRRAAAGLKERDGHASTILVVDDEEGLREMMAEILESNGYKVITASNGLDAVQKYKIHRSAIDMVISDLGMPFMGGEEVFKNLKEMDPSVKVVFVTGYLDDDIKSGILRLGVKYIIQKPFRIEEFTDCVAQVLHG